MFSVYGKIIKDTCEVSEKFNTFFSTVADKIGEDTVYDPTTHFSILEIKNHVDGILQLSRRKFCYILFSTPDTKIIVIVCKIFKNLFL
jgi:hypothetical protein